MPKDKIQIEKPIALYNLAELRRAFFKEAKKRSDVFDRLILQLEHNRINSIFEMYNSLIRSVAQAGGSGDTFKPDNLDNVSVLDLLILLGSNDIRFIHQRKE